MKTRIPLRSPNDQRDIWRIGQLLWISAIIFMCLHMLQWSVKCGPFASGKYQDYCADLTEARATKNIIVNETTVARNKAITRTPYVDLRDSDEPLEEFLPTGHGRSRNNANVRAGPGMEYEVIESLSKGSTVEILEEENNWLKVRINNPGDAEAFGWIWYELLAR